MNSIVEPPPETQSSTPKVTPGPPKLMSLKGLREFRRDPLTVHINTFKQYGDLARLRIGPVSMFILSNPQDFETILRLKSPIYTKGVFSKAIRKVLGNGLLASQGDFWLRQRRMAQPAFNHAHLTMLADQMVVAAQNTAVHWQALAASSQAFNVMGEMEKLTLEITGQTLFGTDVSQDLDMLTDLLGVSETYLVSQLNPLAIPRFIPTRLNRAFGRAMRGFDAVVYRIIEQRRLQSEQKSNDLLALLMQSKDAETGQMMDNQQLHDEVLTFLAAGYATTALALTWLWYLLAKNPDKVAKLQAELDLVLGGRAPQVADLANLPYTRMVVEETLRMYPPAWGLMRQNSQIEELRGYNIPKNSIMFLSIYNIQHHPDYWEEPERFEPERFEPAKAANRPKYAYIPFSHGPHQCIGNHFAMMEMQLIVATLAQEYELELVPTHPVEVDPSFNLKPRYGVKVVATLCKTQ